MTEIPGFVIKGPPRTKKTSNRVVHIPSKGTHRCPACGHVPGTPRVLPSVAYEMWERDALQQCFGIKAGLRKQGVVLPLAGQLSVNAQIYRQQASGDVAGFMQAIGDLLERSGIIANDSLIDDWDGTRRLKDAAKPRVEIFISVLVERAVQEALPL